VDHILTPRLLHFIAHELIAWLTMYPVGWPRRLDATTGAEVIHQFIFPLNGRLRLWPPSWRVIISIISDIA
jgi:hypothetical protein